MGGILRVIAGRFIAALLAALAAAGAATISDIETTIGITQILGSFGITYAAAHKAIDAKINKTDAAAPSEVVETIGE